jgi:hypothetical protein
MAQTRIIHSRAVFLACKSGPDRKLFATPVRQDSVKSRIAWSNQIGIGALCVA